MKTEFKDQMVLVSTEKQKETLDMKLDLRSWGEDKKKNITSHNNSMLLDNRNRVFILEIEPFNTKTVPKSSIRMLVI